jgi:ABC-2 type transport system permease protein
VISEWKAARVTVVTHMSRRGYLVSVPVGVSWFMWLDSRVGSFGNYPLRVLPLIPGYLLTFVLPVAFIAYLPAAVITGRVASTGLYPWLVYGAPLAGLLLYLASRWFWAYMLRHYQSIGGYQGSMP